MESLTYDLRAHISMTQTIDTVKIIILIVV